jgi:tetratricopeptide (TPR) repeat protein
MATVACAVPVHHYGHLDQDCNRSKGENYFRIGIKKVEEMGGDEQALTELAVQAELLGKSAEAADLWKRVLAIDPGSVRALVNLSSTLGRLGRLPEAAETAQQAVALAPQMKEAHFNLALARLLLGDAPRAIDILEGLQQKYPHYYAAIFMRGCAQICQGYHDDGLRTIAALSGTDLWPVLNYSFDELAGDLLRAGREEYHRNLQQSQGRLRPSDAAEALAESMPVGRRPRHALTATAA